MSTAANPADTHAYARFTRRVQAVLIDSIVFMLILAGALVIATSLDSDNIARILGFVIVATWLLYEPVLVSATGSTIGHWWANLRVVDDAGGNIGFGKAVLRVIIKTLLGWYSFVTMLMTTRHQAVHDLLTRSTVQIRDLAKAAPHHHVARRETLSVPGMPSPLRRIAVITGFLAVCLGVFIVAVGLVVEVGLVSERCLDDNPCNWGEVVVLGVVLAVWIGLSLAAAILGWRGRLWGARR